MLTHDELKKLLSYDPLTGEFTRLVRHKGDNNWKRYGVVGSTDSYGYKQISVAGKPYLAHRLAWFYMTGEWPKGEIHHINHVRNDNSWNNLTLARSRSIQMQSQLPRNGAKIKSSTGVTGVAFFAKYSRFHVSMAIKGKRTYLGSFDNLLDAVAARKSAELRYHVPYG